MADQVVEQIDVLLRLVDEAWKVRALTAEYELESERIRTNELRLQVEKLFEKIHQLEEGILHPVGTDWRYVDRIGMKPVEGAFRSPKPWSWSTL